MRAILGKISQPTYTRTREPDVVPMEIGATQVRNLTRQQMIERGLCFYCKEPGHTKFNCPKSRRNGQAQSGAQNQQQYRPIRTAATTPAPNIFQPQSNIFGNKPLPATPTPAPTMSANMFDLPMEDRVNIIRMITGTASAAECYELSLSLS